LEIVVGVEWKIHPSEMIKLKEDPPLTSTLMACGGQGMESREKDKQETKKGKNKDLLLKNELKKGKFCKETGAKARRREDERN